MGMRIRTVKPEFWSDKRLAEISSDARLLAVGLLNFADDEGFFLADPALIRSAVFPFDDDSSRVRRSLPELAAIWIETRMTEKGLVGKVRNFKTHQKIDRPKPSQLKACYEEAEAQPGLPGIVDDESTKDRRGIEANAPQEWIGKEWIGKEWIGKEWNKRGGKPPKPAKEAFRKPDAREVESYAKGIGYKLAGQRFVDYYERQGWKLSNGQPMKDWQAAVRTWQGRDSENGGKSGKKGGDPYAV